MCSQINQSTSIGFWIVKEAESKKREVCCPHFLCLRTNGSQIRYQHIHNPMVYQVFPAEGKEECLPMKHQDYVVFCCHNANPSR